MLYVSHLYNDVITPALKATDTYSESAGNLLLGTALIESRLTYLRQIKGCALGLYQCEPETYTWLMEYLQRKPELTKKICTHCGFERLPCNDPDILIGNLSYATLIARVKYLTIPEALPEADDTEAMALYYKKYYNTKHGKSDPRTYVRLYKEFSIDRT